MPKTPRCEHEPCRGPLPITARADARYCSGRCRTAACRARRSVPKELAARPRWVRRSSRKVPLTVDGQSASSTDPATWSRYRDATASSAGVGLGFVLDGDGIVVLDLDHCLDGDQVEPWAQGVLDAAAGCWVERSAGGDGLHIWGRGRLPGGGGRRLRLGAGTVELYGDGRYIAVTGEPWGGTPPRLGDLQHVINSLL
ncbi:bifunctional DNA primase/polymerase [Streptomyces sp. B15]|uniref:bifunctional DNA primase/polymerase n=1 Tax=Streptomyces sp. B15 TaxID=1537797 RepID=UPI001B36CFD2|nr:bifunctional DNA primase/polymerase [Streptomyces sp. B15]MBQ1122633.1 bifunctional DNA primase/polymerase [Streptomyces sp. B15]